MKSIILSLLIIICLASASFSRYLKRKNHFLNKGDIQLDGIKLSDSQNQKNILEIKNVKVSKEKLEDEHKIVLKFEKEDDAKAKIQKWLNENAIKKGKTEETKEGDYLNINLPKDKIEDWIKFEIPFHDVIEDKIDESLLKHNHPERSLDLAIKKNKLEYNLGLRFDSKKSKENFRQLLLENPEFWIEIIKNKVNKENSGIDDDNYYYYTCAALKKMQELGVEEKVEGEVKREIRKLLKITPIIMRFDFDMNDEC